MWRKCLLVALALLAVTACVGVVTPPAAHAQSTATTTTPAAPMPAAPMPATGPVGCQPGATPGSAGSCSPMCAGASALDATTRDACQSSGSIARHYPLQNYSLDINVDTTSWNPGNWISAALQNLAGLLWLIAISIFDGVLTLLQWAFSLDLLGRPEVMQQVKDALMTFHEHVFGNAWLTAALACLALSGMWNGLVRGRAIETVGGVAASVALMALSLAVISRPDATVMPLTTFSNNASLSILAGISHGTVDDPQQAMASSEQGLFDAFVLRPWCRLNFGDVEYCLNAHRDSKDAPVRARQPGELSVADAWLQFPPGSPQRQQLYQKTLTGKEPEPAAEPGDYDCDRKEDWRDEPGASIPTPPMHRRDYPGHEHDPIPPEAKVLILPHAIGGGAAFQEGEKEQQAVLDQALIATHKSEREITWDDLYAACDYLNGGGKPAQSKVLGAVWGDPDKVWLQGATGTFERIALLLMTIIALLGATLLFGYMAIRLLLARVFAILYLVLLVPTGLAAACGRAGRGACLACGQGCFRETALGFIYAVLLAVQLIVFALIAGLKVDPFVALLLLIVYTWGLFLKRNHILGFLSLDQRPGEGGLGLGAESPRGLGLSNLYYSTRLLGQAAGLATAPARAGLRHVQRARFERGASETEALRELQSDQELAAARGVLADQDARQSSAEARKADLLTEKRAERDLVSRYHEERLDLEARMENLNRTRLPLQAEVGEARGRRDLLQSGIDDTNEKIAGLGDNMVLTEAERNRRISALEDERDTLEWARDTTEAELAPKEAELGPLDAEYDRLETRHTMTMFAMGKAEDRAVAINRDLNATDRELRDIDDERRTPVSQAARARAIQGDRDEGKRALFGDDRTSNRNLSRRERIERLEAASRSGAGQVEQRTREIQKERRRQQAYERKRNKVNRGRRGMR